MRSGCPGLQDKFFEALETDEDGIRIARTIQACQIEDTAIIGFNYNNFTTQPCRYR